MHLLLVTTTTGYQTRAFEEAAGRLGVRCTIASDRCKHLDDPWHDGAIPVRFEDPIRYAEVLAGAGRFDGIAALGDRTTFLAALTAERAGLRFHPPAAVEAAASKFLTRERFRAAGLRTPDYRRWPVDVDARAAARDTRYPCVLKPLGMSGSRGVIRADDETGFAAAFERIASLLAARDVVRRHDSRDRFVQVEDFIPGAEFAIEGLMTGGRLRVLAVFDKPDPLDGPYFEETIYVTPSREAEAVRRAIEAAVEEGVRALGLSDGPIHAEARVNENGVYLLEIAARPIGGLCARALRFTGGMPLEELILRHALGEDVSAYVLEPEASGVMMIPIPKAGIYKDVAGEEEARRTRHIVDVVVAAKPGQSLQTFPEAASYLGFLFARAARPEDAESALREAHGKLKFEIATELAAARK